MRGLDPFRRRLFMGDLPGGQRECPASLNTGHSVVRVLGVWIGLTPKPPYQELAFAHERGDALGRAPSVEGASSCTGRAHAGDSAPLDALGKRHLGTEVLATDKWGQH